MEQQLVKHTPWDYISEVPWEGCDSFQFPGFAQSQECGCFLTVGGMTHLFLLFWFPPSPPLSLLSQVCPLSSALTFFLPPVHVCVCAIDQPVWSFLLVVSSQNWIPLERSVLPVAVALTQCWFTCVCLLLLVFAPALLLTLPLVWPAWLVTIWSASLLHQLQCLYLLRPQTWWTKYDGQNRPV